MTLDTSFEIVIRNIRLPHMSDQSLITLLNVFTIDIKLPLHSKVPKELLRLSYISGNCCSKFRVRHILRVPRKFMITCVVLEEFEYV